MEKREELFKKLIEKEKSFLMNNALKLTRNREDAEDLLHDTILLAHRGFPRFKKESKFRAWAGRIMLNQHINNVRRKESKNVLVDDFTKGEYDPVFFMNREEMPFSENPEKVFMNSNTDKNVMEAYFRINEEYRKVFSLYHFDGYRYEEIAKAMDIPIGTVKSRIYRARECMIENLKKIESEVGYDLAGGRL